MNNNNNNNKSSNDVPPKANEGTKNSPASVIEWVKKNSRKVSGEKDGAAFVEVAQKLLVAISSYEDLRPADLLTFFQSGKYSSLINPQKVFEDGQAKSGAQFKKNFDNGQRGAKLKAANASVVRIVNLLTRAAQEQQLDISQLAWGHIYQTEFCKAALGVTIEAVILEHSSSTSAWAQSRTTANMSKFDEWLAFHDIRMKCCYKVIEWCQKNGLFNFVQAGATRNGFTIASSFFEFNDKGRAAWASFPEADDPIQYATFAPKEVKITPQNFKSMCKIATPVSTKWATQCYDYRNGTRDRNSAVAKVKARMEGVIKAGKDTPEAEWDLFSKTSATVAMFYKWFAFISTTIRNINGEGGKRGGPNTHSGGLVKASEAWAIGSIDLSGFKDAKVDKTAGAVEGLTFE